MKVKALELRWMLQNTVIEFQPMEGDVPRGSQAKKPHFDGLVQQRIATLVCSLQVAVKAESHVLGHPLSVCNISLDK